MTDLSREDVARLRSLLEKATPDWRRDRFGVIRAGEFKQYVNGSCQSQIASFTSDDGGQQRDIDCDLTIAAISALPALLALAEAVAGAPEAEVFADCGRFGVGCYDYDAGPDEYPFGHLVGQRVRLVRVQGE